MKQKFKNILKENKWLFITFFVSCMIISIIYTLSRIAPFGNNSMLDVDFYHQYGPLLNELYDRIKTGENLLYSFNTGGGIPFYRNFLNYLSSPFNLILLLFKKENIVMAFSIVILLKVVFSSLFMSFYLKKTFKKNNVFICIFSLLYSYSGYFCSYYWNIMWLDGMVFLPIIMYGINKIIDDKKPICYVISLALMLFANYFIAYMICLFAIIYFIGYFLYKKKISVKEFLKTGFMFFLASLLAAGLASFAILPLYSSLSSISATKDSFPSLSFNFALSDYLFNHIPGVNRTVFASDTLPLPNICSGIITLVSIPLLLFNKKINLKGKLFSVFALLLFFLIFNINTIDFIWHALHIPNDLPYRYSFIYVFVLITIGFYSVSNIKSDDKIKISVSFMITIIFVLLASKTNFKNISDDRVIVCLILLLAYYLLYLFTFIKKIPKWILKLLLIIIVSIECIYSIDTNWQIDHDIKTFMSDKKTYQELINKAKEIDNDLYRIEKTNYLTLNDGAWYDYNGLSTFSSMAYEKTAIFQRKFGMAGNNINSYYYKETVTPIYNTVFNVRYLMGNYIDNNYFSLVSSKDNYNLYKFDYNTSIAFAVNKDLQTLKMIDYSPFVNQSNFVLSATGVNDIFIPLKVSNILNGNIIQQDFLNNSNGEFNYEITKGINYIEFELLNPIKDNIYLYVGGYDVNSIEVDGTYYSITSDEYYIIDVGNKTNDIINVKINTNSNETGNLMFYAYYINGNAFNEYYNKLSNNLLRVNQYNDTIIKGDISLVEDKLMFTSLSYDPGYSVYVDGKKVKIKKVLDTFLGFDIKNGKHSIKIVYYPEYLKEGIYISSASLVILILYAYLSKNKKIQKR